MKKNIILIALILCNSLWSQIKLYDSSIDSIITNTISHNIKFNVDKENSYIIFSDVDEDKRESSDIKFALLDNEKINDFVKNNKDYCYRLFLNYKFSFDGVVFYERIFINNVNSQQDSDIKFTVNYINTISLKFIKKKYITPQVATEIALQKGFDKITYQSINEYYRTKKGKKGTSIVKTSWVFKGESNNRDRVLVINPRNGKIVKDYYQGAIK